MIPRCIYCGKKMNQVTIDGVLCWQCPRDGYTVPVNQEPVPPVAEAEQ